jgi:hypothetical protein
MRGVLRSTAALVIAGGILAIAALLVGVDRDDLVLDAYLVFLAGVAGSTAARLAAAAFPRPRGVVPRTLAKRAARPSRPESLARMEDVVALAEADQLELHVRLRPVLADVAAAGYAAAGGRGGTVLPPEAEPQFTAATWDLVRADRPRPANVGERGIDPAILEAVVGELESMLPR